MQLDSNVSNLSPTEVQHKFPQKVESSNNLNIWSKEQKQDNAL